MRAHGGAILQHGAILLDWNGRLQAGALGLTDDSGLRPQITTLRDELGLVLPRSVLDKTLVEAFTSELEVEFVMDQPSNAEHGREQELINSFIVHR